MAGGKLRSYLVDLGNSAKGCIGICIRVNAHSKQEATEIANAFLNEQHEIAIDVGDQPFIEYANIYLNGAAKVRNVPSGEIENIDDEEAA